MNKIKNISFFFVLFYTCNAQSITPGRQIENQEKFLERQRQQQEIQKKINEPVNKIDFGNDFISSEPESKPGSIKLNDIHIDFDGKKIRIDFSQIINQYINKPVNNVQIFNLIRQLTAELYEKGFSTSAITLKKPAVVDGVLQLKIEWGILDALNINKSPAQGFREKSMLFTALPYNRYNIVNMHDLDQAIENMNNGFKTAKIKIEPSNKFSHSLVDFNVEYDRTPKLSFRMDNTSQSDDYTPYRYISNLLLGDLILVNDVLNFGGNFKNYSADNRNEYGLNSSYAVPFGYSKLTFSWTYSNSESPFIIAGKNFSYISESETYAVKLSRNLYRNNKGKFGAYFEFKVKDNTTFFDKEFLSQNSLNYTDVTLGFDLLYKKGADTLYTDISFTHGINGNNGVYASYNSQGAYDWAKFFSGTITYNKPFSLNGNNLNFRSQTGFQYTSQSLVSNYQQTLGDEYTIRGLNSKSAVNGDSGVYVNNTLEFPLNFNIYNTAFNFTPYIGLDLGYSRNNLFKDNNFLSSVASGLRFSTSTVDYSISYGQVFMSNKEHIPSGIVYMNGGLSF